MDRRFRCTVWKTGNSCVITIPSKFMSWFHIEPGHELELEMVENIIKKEESSKKK